MACRKSLIAFSIKYRVDLVGIDLVRVDLVAIDLMRIDIVGHRTTASKQKQEGFNKIIDSQLMFTHHCM